MLIAWISTALGFGYGGMSLEKLAGSLPSFGFSFPVLAIVLALIPHVAAWGKLQIDNALSAAGTSVAAVGVEKLGQSGILYEGLSVPGGGAILSSLILASVAVFVIERQFLRAAAFALAGAVLTFFGFMHGEQIGLAESPAVALSYLLVSGGARRLRSARAAESVPPRRCAGGDPPAGRLNRRILL